ncbi:hypothetical protein ACQEVF_57700 [Nonomuraea polychroma]|uniref:hypothetical protein n=1 Tax=Nonomuraea polychroma TaxID=46176 RepID=UPI003D91CF4A
MDITTTSAIEAVEAEVTAAPAAEEDIEIDADPAFTDAMQFIDTMPGDMARLLIGQHLIGLAEIGEMCGHTGSGTVSGWVKREPGLAACRVASFKAGPVFWRPSVEEYLRSKGRLPQLTVIDPSGGNAEDGTPDTEPVAGPEVDAATANADGAGAADPAAEPAEETTPTTNEPAPEEVVEPAADPQTAEAADGKSKGSRARRTRRA